MTHRWPWQSIRVSVVNALGLRWKLEGTKTMCLTNDAAHSHRFSQFHVIPPLGVEPHFNIAKAHGFISNGNLWCLVTYGAGKWICNHFEGWHVLNPIINIINITNHPSSPRTWGLWNWDFSWVYHGFSRYDWDEHRDDFGVLIHLSGQSEVARAWSRTTDHVRGEDSARSRESPGGSEDSLKKLKNSWKMLKNNWNMINMLKHAEFVAGSPFLLQLLGSCSWRADLNLHCCTMTEFWS